MATPTIGRLVRIRNNGDKPFNLKYDKQPFIVQPHSELFVPYECMCLYMGAPDAVDIDARRRPRTDEYQRLRIKYGVYEDNTRMAQNIPQLEAFTVDGERIITVLDDPEGRHLTPADLKTAENELLREHVARLQAEMASILTRMNNGEVSVATATDESGSPEGDATQDEKPGSAPAPGPIVPPAPIAAPAMNPPQDSGSKSTEPQIPTEDTPSKPPVGPKGGTK